ncbi:hypothetical protein JAAARDRAFT_168823 [Jaapia argillacea MUCL 33604]|uniref:Copper homeostasis protein cutC homolog n=1 Tax=Jaapia argillacea MUCL 33604 TaxID=933084 RepID=A0A067Q852_9AGAM|nr:hypothetical protein JAAARDRAFT_168823 [Jaapia argillacea MUCL 33604]
MSPFTGGRILIEVCVDSVESAVAAVRGGADRLELCGNLGIGGGTTPSMGLLKMVQRAVPMTPIMVMIRPRTGDFLYSEDELDVIIQDVRVFKASGLVAGIVIGVLTSEGCVDIKKTKRIVEEASPLQVCFHRAFDMTRDGTEAFADLSSIDGLTRILTSGLGKSAPSTLPALENLLHLADKQRSKNQVVILPGSGINPGTIESILDSLLPLGLREIHLSGGSWMNGGMVFRRDGMGMGVDGNGEWGIWRTDQQTIRSLRTIVDQACGSP